MAKLLDIDEPSFQVVWPCGPLARDLREVAPRLDTLDGKVIAEVWNWMYEGDRAFPIIREELLKRYPALRIVEYENFGNIHGADEHAVVERLPDDLRAHGVVGVLAGVGH